MWRRGVLYLTSRWPHLPGPVIHPGCGWRWWPVGEGGGLLFLWTLWGPGRRCQRRGAGGRSSTTKGSELTHTHTHCSEEPLLRNMPEPVKKAGQLFHFYSHFQLNLDYEQGIFNNFRFLIRFIFISTPQCYFITVIGRQDNTVCHFVHDVICAFIKMNTSHS